MTCYHERYHEYCYHETKHVDSKKPPENPWGTPTTLTGKCIFHITLEGKQHCSLMSLQFIKI